GAEVVTVSEPAGDDDRIGAVQIAALMPDERARSTETLDGGEHVVLTVRSRKDDNGDLRAHAEVARGVTVTAACWITGFASSRRLISSASRCAETSSDAESEKRKTFPTRTPLTPSKPSAGSARSIVRPSGSAIPSRPLTST